MENVRETIEVHGETIAEIPEEMSKEYVAIEKLSDCSVAVIDDVLENVKILSAMLKDAGFHSFAFLSGREALQSMEIYPPDIVLLDVSMPDMNGFEVARAMKASHVLKDVPIIFVTALSDIESKIEAYKSGGVDYITKPFAFEEVRARVETHLKISRIQRYTNKYNAYLKAELEREYKRTLEAQEQLINLHKNNFNAQMAVIEIVTGFVEINSSQLNRSIQRVQSLCGKMTTYLARQPKYSGIITSEFLNDIIFASALYDCGMAGLPKNLINSMQKYSPSDREEMQNHTHVGSSILWRAREKFPDNSMLKMAVELAASHHERYDGSGYPNGLRGESIPLCSRILAVADVYDALISNVQYRIQYTVKGAISTITKMWSSKFDPNVLAAFQACIEVEKEEELLSGRKS